MRLDFFERKNNEISSFLFKSKINNKKTKKDLYFF